MRNCSVLRIESLRALKERDLTLSDHCDSHPPLRRKITTMCVSLCRGSKTRSSILLLGSSSLLLGCLHNYPGDQALGGSCTEASLHSQRSREILLSTIFRPQSLKFNSGGLRVQNHPSMCVSNDFCFKSSVEIIVSFSLNKCTFGRKHILQGHFSADSNLFMQLIVRISAEIS